MKRFLISITLLAVTACAGQQGPRYAEGVIDRALAGAPGMAQPSDIVTTELAFARLAQEKGQWTAFREYAADGALFFGPTGVSEAKPWLEKQPDPAQAVAWDAHQIWMSCDGSLAVSTGAFDEPGGPKGRFYTVWQRQQDRSYKFVFDFGVPMEQPPIAPDLIQGNVARCGVPLELGLDATENLQRSSDGTLAWSWTYPGDGTRRFTVWSSRNGREAVVAEVLDTTGPQAE